MKGKEKAAAGGPWFQPVASGKAPYMNRTDGVPDVMDVLRELAYPAEKWQITATAEIYGADVHTRRALYDLPARVYESPADVRSALPATAP